MTDMTIRELLNELNRNPAAKAEFEADPDGYFSAHGFDLPTELVGEAIVNVAATLPPETAEHLAPFTISHSPIPPIDAPPGDASVQDGAEGPAGIDVATGLGLLASAPAVVEAAAQTDGDLDEAEFGGFGAGSPEALESTDVVSAPDAPGQPLDDDGALDPTGLDSGALDVMDDEEGLELFTADSEAESFERIDDNSIESRDPADLDDLAGFE
jgi:hypothetical protein